MRLQAEQIGQTRAQQSQPADAEQLAASEPRMVSAATAETTDFSGGQLMVTIAKNIQPNQRLFGLFRYSDATAARVRIVKHRGDWPKKLPPVKEQILAQP
jgi:hypothetical protein